MTDKRLLVDFENVQQIDLARLDASFRVTIFLGVSQRSIPISLVTDAQKLGTRVDWRQVDASGRNALDFFIAHELGRIAERETHVECIVLSRDTGFDPLLRHLNKNGLTCRRIGSITELDPTAAAVVDDANYNRVVEILAKIDKKHRPRKRKTLLQHILSTCRTKIDQAEAERIVDTLVAKKLVLEANNALTYEF
jgi:hypothetical protein